MAELKFPVLCTWANGEADGEPIIATNSDELTGFFERAQSVSGYTFDELIDGDLECYEIDENFRLTQIRLVPPPKIVKWSKD